MLPILPLLFVQCIIVFQYLDTSLKVLLELKFCDSIRENQNICLIVTTVTRQQQFGIGIYPSDQLVIQNNLIAQKLNWQQVAQRITTGITATKSVCHDIDTDLIFNFEQTVSRNVKYLLKLNIRQEIKNTSHTCSHMYKNGNRMISKRSLHQMFTYIIFKIIIIETQQTVNY